MLYIFGGQDSFSRRSAIDALKKKLGGDDQAFLNVVTLEGAKVTAEQLFAACNSAPFFADRRLVVVDGLLSRFESREKKEPGSGAAKPSFRAAKPSQAFLSCLSNLPPTIDVVLEEDSASRTNSLVRELEKVGQVRWFAPLRQAELPAWIDRRLRELGGSLTPGATRLLAETVGNNLWLLAAEVDKLLVYRRGDRINEDDVRQLVSYARDASVFAMVDAVIERRADVALQCLHQLLDQGAAVAYLLVMITRQFRLLIQAKELALQKARPADIRRILAISSDFVFDKTMKQLGGYSLGQLEEIYHLLLRVDMETKTGKTEQEIAIDLLVLELCRRPGFRPTTSPRPEGTRP